MRFTSDFRAPKCLSDKIKLHLFSFSYLSSLNIRRYYFQAEDRCHRVGQTKEVKVIRFTSEDTIEEGIHNIAMEKLKLEQDVTGEVDADSKTKKKDVARLLKVNIYYG